jgi:hypothetical protein
VVVRQYELRSTLAGPSTSVPPTIESRTSPQVLADHCTRDCSFLAAPLTQQQKLPRGHRTVSHRLQPMATQLLLTFLNSLYGSIIMRVSYGSDNIEYNKELIQETQTFGHDFMEYSPPGKLLVATFPSLEYLPSWLPGTGWKRIVESLRTSSGRVRSRPYTELKKRMVGSVAESSCACSTDRNTEGRHPG